jgi:hypothetical protein
MVRILVVNHDLDLADQEADSIRRSGHDVAQCSGPTRFACPIMRGEPCPVVHGVDVVVYDVWASGEAGGAQALIDGLRDLHPDVPVILTAPGIELDWVQTDGAHGVIPLVGVPTGERLRAAIDEAIGSWDRPATAAPSG